MARPTSRGDDSPPLQPAAPGAARPKAGDKTAWLVQEGKVDKVTVSEHYISGVIKPETGESAGRPFMTVPLCQSDLDELLAKNKVNFVV